MLSPANPPQFTLTLAGTATNLPRLPSLPTFTPPQNPFKTPGTLAGETLS